MKTKFFTLLMALLAFVWSAKAAEITSLRLTLSMNGGETFTEMIPASGFDELLLGGYITSLKIHKAEVTTSGTFTDMKFKATMYKTANGGPESDAEWQEVGFVDVGDGNWMIDIPGGRDLVDGSWDNKFKTFEFYIQGKDNSGNDVFYNNGGEDYKVTFSTGSGGTLINKIQFLDGITAGLTFSLDDSYKEYNFNGAGDRVPEDQLGELSSLCIDQFALLFKTAEGVSTDDVSLQYRIYEDGEEPSGSWNGIGATHLDHQGDNQMFCYTDMMGRNVTNDLEPNKSYVLEAWYQVVVDGEYFVLCKDKEGSKFRFFLTENTSQEEIYSVILTISHNGGEPYEVYFDHENQPTLNLEGQTTSLKIMKAEVWTSDGIRSVEVFGTMYNTENGGPSGSNEWRAMPLNPSGSGYWMLEFGKEGYEIIEEEWLNDNRSKTFQFYVKGQDGSGNDILYNNGGADYKVTFSTGEGADWKIKFLEESTADLLLNVGGEGRSYSFNGDGSRTPEDQLGQISSLAIDQFALWFRYNDGVKTNDVSLQYRIYEEGQEPDGGWSRIDAPQFYDQGSNTMFFYTEMMGVDVTSGLEPNRVYILEVNYQVVVGEEYFFLGKNKESSKFRFTLTENVVQDEIYSVILTLKHNGGEPYEVYFEHENMPTLNLEGQTTSLKIMKAEVWTSEGVQSVNVVGTMYNTENGGPTGGDEWRSMPLTQSDNGYWLLDFDKEGYEIVEDEWINNDKSKTFQFYVTAVDRQGNGIIYDNEGQDYKVSFTTGSGGGGDGIRSMTLTVSCDGEVFTESFPSEGWEIHAIEGLISSIKVMRVEVETSESLTYVGFCSTIYDTADGWQHDDTAWDWIPMDNQGGGHWVLDWGEGREFVASEWLFQNMAKTLEFFADGGDANGNKYKYANGISDYGYDNNYKVTFTPGVDPDGISLVSASKANGATYNLAGQRVGKDYKGIVVKGGRKLLVK